jgi:hypothetical protein
MALLPIIKVLALAFAVISHSEGLLMHIFRHLRLGPSLQPEKRAFEGWTRGSG